jgi:putative intracellular protease/amidase
VEEVEMKALAVCLTLLLGPAQAPPAAAQSLVAPKTGTIKVAFVLGEGATVIDFAGPWDVFETVMLGDDRKIEESMPFQLYTVAATREPIHSSGGRSPGMTIVPAFDFATAPSPDIVVVGAQRDSPGLSEWLQKIYADKKIVMSVCTGAFKLAKAGLLDGKSATTHHYYLEQFTSRYPNVKLITRARYVQAGPLLYTAGGEMSGIDLALHLVEGYFGRGVAQATADRMEYQGSGWQTNKGISGVAPTIHEEWRAQTSGGPQISLHVAVQGPKITVTADNPSLGATGVPTAFAQDGSRLTFTFEIAGHASKYVATANDADDVLTGELLQDGTSHPLALVKQKRARG